MTISISHKMAASFTQERHRVVGKGGLFSQVCTALSLSFCGKQPQKDKVTCPRFSASKKSWIWSSVPVRLYLTGCGKEAHAVSRWARGGSSKFHI